MTPTQMVLPKEVILENYYIFVHSKCTYSARVQLIVSVDRIQKVVTGDASTIFEATCRALNQAMDITLNGKPEIAVLKSILDLQCQGRYQKVCEIELYAMEYVKFLGIKFNVREKVVQSKF